MKLSFPSNIVKTVLSVVLGLLMFGIGLHFLLDEGVQLTQISDALQQCDRLWLYFGIVLSMAYIGLHGEMYRQSFKALGLKVELGSMIRLYLKRNLISVFLPAGFLASQAFFGAEVAKSEKVQERDVLSASGIFSVAGLLSMVVVVVPALGWLLTQHILPDQAAFAFLAVSTLLIGTVWSLFNFIKRGFVYHLAQKHLPVFTAQLDTLEWSRFQVRYFLYAVLLSCLVEVVGVMHVWVAARVLGESASLSMAFAGYMAVLVVLMTSPFLRGVGAVEALLALVLIHFGLVPVAAVSTAVLFRFFEFWLILLLAFPVFLFRPGNLLVRIAPSLLLFALGIINILSGLTPALAERAKLLEDYLPLSTIHASAALTVAAGFVLLGTAFHLLRGLRSAWWLALGLSTVSLISHLAKGFDYEEASLALLTIGALIYQRRQYLVRNDFLWTRRGWGTALIVVITSLILGAIGFYLLNQRHFGADFGWKQSAVYAFQTFLMMDPSGLNPRTTFGLNFLDMMHLLGGLTLLFLAYSVFRPFLPSLENEDSDREKALEMVRLFGRSSLDYFKTYHDKQFFFPQNGQSFVAYKNTVRYALALENPVAPDDVSVRESIQEFDRFCARNGLRSIYYRIPEASASMYRSLGKSLLPLGQEAVVNLGNFTLDGKERKALRNSLNKMDREGFQFVVHDTPIHDSLLQQLRGVSDAWLKMLQRAELSFSQGIFDESELKHQTVLTLENAEGKILAFINLIPGGSADEANFDLMRRTEDAPPGTMDFLFTHMFLYLKEKGFKVCNLGLVPMSGLEHPTNLSENLLKLAYERVPRFANYKSLRFFKEKFDPIWETKYVAYDSPLDLMNLPIVLGRVVH